MNERKLETKLVPFMGAELMAVKDNDGKVWAGVSYICNGIGMTKHQKDRQITNIQADHVLSNGCLKFEAGVFDAGNEAFGIKLEYIPLWLAKISITPTMERENPELVERLVQYQLKAKDVLAAAFLPQYADRSADDYRAETRRLEADNKARALALREQAAKDKRVNIILTGFVKAKTAPEKLALLAAYRAEGYGNRTLDIAERAIIDSMGSTKPRKIFDRHDAEKFQSLLDKLEQAGVRKTIHGTEYVCIPASYAREAAAVVGVPFDTFLSWVNENGRLRVGADGKRTINVRIESGQSGRRCLCLKGGEAV